MPKKPVIFLSFANSSIDPLSQLNKEKKAIKQALDEGFLNNQYLLKISEDISINELFFELNRMNDTVFLFHFAGHANKDHILLRTDNSRSSEIALMEGIIPKLAQQKNLKCVVLNGCSTHEHAEKLLASGVPVVIGTSSVVGDKVAREFSSGFYTALANNQTIGEAFDSASNQIKSKYHPESRQNRAQLKEKLSEDNLDIKYRDFVLDFEGEEPSDTFSWHIFFPKNSNALEVRLPNKSVVEIKKNPLSFSAQPRPDTDKLLIDIFNEMLQYDQGLYEEFEKRPDMGISKIKVAILTRLPLTTERQFLLLFKQKSLDKSYIQKLLKTYDTLIEFFLFALFSQLWDEKHSDPEITYPDSFSREIQAFFKLSEEERTKYNSLPLFKSIGEIFEENSFSFFIEELGVFFDELKKEESIYNAFKAMESIKEGLNEINSENFMEESKKCERAFGEIFTKWSFCIRYKLMVINEIFIRRERHREPRYEIDRALYNETYLIEPDSEVENYNTFTDDQSVLLIKDKKNLNLHLSLNPFVIDKNVLDYRINPMDKFTTSNPYFYDYFDSEKGVYFYKSGDHHDWLEVSSTQYESVWKMIQRFIRTI